MAIFINKCGHIVGWIVFSAFILINLSMLITTLSPRLAWTRIDLGLLLDDDHLFYNLCAEGVETCLHVDKDCFNWQTYDQVPEGILLSRDSLDSCKHAGQEARTLTTVPIVIIGVFFLSQIVGWIFTNKVSVKLANACTVLCIVVCILFPSLAFFSWDHNCRAVVSRDMHDYQRENSSTSEGQYLFADGGSLLCIATAIVAALSSCCGLFPYCIMKDAMERKHDAKYTALLKEDDAVPVQSASVDIPPEQSPQLIN